MWGTGRVRATARLSVSELTSAGSKRMKRVQSSVYEGLTAPPAGVRADYSGDFRPGSVLTLGGKLQRR